MDGSVVSLKTKHDLKIITVTPEMATDLLENNKMNRPLRQHHVERIADQIAKGKWRFNGDTIKVATTRDVLDGQHRLWAVIEAKKPIETVIIHGIDPEAFSTIDTIRQSRSGSDVLSLMGVERYRPTVSAALTWLIRWQRKCLPTYRDPVNKVENSDIEAAFKAHPKIIHAAERAHKLRRLANVSLMAFFYYVLSNRDPFLAERMMATLEDPERIAINDPFFRLRAYFTADHHKAKDPLVTLALCIKAANAAASGQKIDKLKWANQGKNAEDFPQLTVKTATKQAA